MKIDGREIANEILEDLKKRVGELAKKNITPCLAILIVGNDPASKAYVRQKELKGERIGAKITIKQFSNSISQSNLLTTIQQFNNDNNVHGIIVQQPFPSSIDQEKIVNAITPQKDVDGFHPNSKFEMPIALAVLKILEEIFFSLTRSHLARLKGETLISWLRSKKIVVIGKGETGGQPIIQTLRKMSIEPTVIDSKTKNPKALTKTADIIISAVGKSNIVKPNMIKKGVILISIGLHKGSDGKLHGDYEEEKIKNIVSFYTPTPGGVGPLNVAMLLENLVKAAENISKL